MQHLRGEGIKLCTQHFPLSSFFKKAVMVFFFFVLGNIHGKAEHKSLKKLTLIVLSFKT